MAAFIRSVLAQVNTEIARVLAPQAIEQTCRELKYCWRRCTLDPATTVYAFLRQSLEGNTACDHVPHLTGLAVTAVFAVRSTLFCPLILTDQAIVMRCSALMSGSVHGSHGVVTPTTFTESPLILTKM